MWTFLFVLCLDQLSRRHYRAAGLAVGALALTRPEGVLLGGLLSLAAWQMDRMRGRWTLGVFALAVLGVEAFRLRYYGAWVPNTFHAKSPDVVEGVRYLLDYWGWGIGAVGPLVLLPALRLKWARGVVALVLIMAAGTVWSGGDWMPGWRRFSVVTVGLAVLAGVGAVGTARARLWVRVGVAGMLIGALISAVRGHDSGTFPHGEMAKLGAVALATPGVGTVALVDIGRFGWVYTGRIVDLVGLTDAAVAHREGTHGEKRWDEAWFRAQGADLLIARSATPIRDPMPGPPVVGAPEREMVRSVLNRGGYTMRAVLAPTGGQWLMVFARDGLVLPPALWGPPAPKDLRTLLGG
jgi:hypothetical protein